ncbi:MAG: GGDEF domain-containing protein [Anaerolineales bacterium]|nr:GGDEF domain-containing protein [Anaerolineales bacterium]
MKLSDILKNIKYQEFTGYVLPSSIAAAIIFLVIILDVILGNYPEQKKEFVMISTGIGGSIYVILQTLLIAPRVNKYRTFYIWANAIISGLGLSLVAITLDETRHIFFDILLILAVISISILSGRGPTYLLIIISETSNTIIHLNKLTSFLAWTIHFIPLAASIVITETILRLRQATQDHIRRLETINTFSQQINSSLETDQVLSLLNAALQKALTADSYYVGLVDNGAIRLDLFYDAGEYFTDVEVPIDNTLAGWIIKNQTPLFLPDLSDGIQLPGIQRNIIGKDRSSLSWIGVPMRTVHINGLLAVASYKANTFSHTDMDLLSNLAQHAALALDNTVHHQQVEQQSRLDSLTGTYNHRSFLQALQEQIDDAQLEKKVVSLIMLDIDYFKRYNDSFGHQVGDLVLIKLCETIQQNIKKGDIVGRWGGEEFAIALPGARGDEAHQVAKRIQKTMQELVLSHPKHEEVPAPTVSQGISVFPDEADEIDRFIYLADQRLYKAKERGRNQIEPDSFHWNSIQSIKKMHGV